MVHDASRQTANPDRRTSAQAQTSRAAPACSSSPTSPATRATSPDVELDHAQDILADLIGHGRRARCGRRSGWRSSRATPRSSTLLAESVDAAALLDAVERCYFAFRRRLRDIRQASSCDCNACMRSRTSTSSSSSTTDRSSGRGSPGARSSSAVPSSWSTACSRTTSPTTAASRAYALYTDACVAAMGLDPGRRRPRASMPRRTSASARSSAGFATSRRRGRTSWTRARVVVVPADASRTYTANLPAPPAVVWEFVTSPGRRPQWQHGVTDVEEQPGRPGAAASGRSTTACTARTRSSRRSSTGGRTTT